MTTVKQLALSLLALLPPAGARGTQPDNAAQLREWPGRWRKAARPADPGTRRALRRHIFRRQRGARYNFHDQYDDGRRDRAAQLCGRHRRRRQSIGGPFIPRRHVLRHGSLRRRRACQRRRVCLQCHQGRIPALQLCRRQRRRALMGRAGLLVGLFLRHDAGGRRNGMRRPCRVRHNIPDRPENRTGNGSAPLPGRHVRREPPRDAAYCRGWHPVRRYPQWRRRGMRTSCWMRNGLPNRSRRQCLQARPRVPGRFRRRRASERGSALRPRPFVRHH